MPSNNPLPHQQRAVDKLLRNDQPGLILWHGLGSGKTRTSIEAYKALHMPTSVIVPASLAGNYRKELDKWVGGQPKDVDIVSQQLLGRTEEGQKPPLKNEGLMIVDEAHRLRNAGSNTSRVIHDIPAQKKLLLTGTPIYNHPSDLATLVNTVAQEDILPMSESGFEQSYMTKEKVQAPLLAKIFEGAKDSSKKVINERKKKDLAKILNKYIDYYPGSKEGFPEVKQTTVSVPMSTQQERIYDTIMGKAPWTVRTMVKYNLPPSKSDITHLRAFLNGARLVSDSTAGFVPEGKEVVSSKIDTAFKHLKDKLDSDKTYKGIVYSNFINSGVNEYKKRLDANKIPYGEFTGEVKSSIRDNLVKKYNENKLRVLLLSSAGAEGLDLKGTRMVQVLEPHFNNEKIKQVIGRAARYQSHAALPKEKQNVLVENYLSTKPWKDSWWNRLWGIEKPTSTDEYLKNMAEQKEKLNDQFLDLVRNQQ